MPSAVHLVAEAPKLYSVRLFNTVASSEIRPISAALVVAIFNKISCRIRTSCAKINGHHAIRVCLFAPLHKFICAKCVWLCCAPCKIKSFWSAFNGADTVFPIIAGNEISARIANDRHIQLFNKLYNILPKAVFIRGRVTGFINSAVNRSAQMLYKRAVYSFIDFADFKFLGDCDFCFHNKTDAFLHF